MGHHRVYGVRHQTQRVGPVAAVRKTIARQLHGHHRALLAVMRIQGRDLGSRPGGVHAMDQQQDRATMAITSAQRLRAVQADIARWRGQNSMYAAQGGRQRCSQVKFLGHGEW